MNFHTPLGVSVSDGQSWLSLELLKLIISTQPRLPELGFAIAMVLAFAPGFCIARVGWVWYFFVNGIQGSTLYSDTPSGV